MGQIAHIIAIFGTDYTYYYYSQDRLHIFRTDYTLSGQITHYYTSRGLFITVSEDYTLLQFMLSFILSFKFSDCFLSSS